MDRHVGNDLVFGRESTYGNDHEQDDTSLGSTDVDGVLHEESSVFQRYCRVIKKEQRAFAFSFDS